VTVRAVVENHTRSVDERDFSMSTSIKFTELSKFISKDMRMSHIYQPVMLMELLQRGGKASADEIAKAILLHDPSQIEYYKQITHNMVGRVLTKNHAITTRDSDMYALNGFSQLSSEEANLLITECKTKLEEYLEKRGDSVWQHRTKSGRYVSGTKRYEVLKRAKFRCELCGISAEEKALEVDHIEPRNWGGEDDLSICKPSVTRATLPRETATTQTSGWWLNLMQPGKPDACFARLRINLSWQKIAWHMQFEMLSRSRDSTRF
jgi:hypothetical protein